MTSSFFKINSNPPIVKFSDPIRRVRVLIGNDVWIGDNAFIYSGVRVGDGSIIAAGAIVTRDVEPYEVVGGVPAKHLRFRFEDEGLRCRLLALKWHEFDPSLLREIDVGKIDDAVDCMELWTESLRLKKSVVYQSTELL